MDLLHSMTFTFLTLDQLNKLEAIPCIILLYCNKKYDNQERDSFCDRFVISQCRWFTAVGVDSDMWEDALDEADLRNNPDQDECWAVTESDEVLNTDSVQQFLDVVIDNSVKAETTYIIGDTTESLHQLQREILTNYKSYDTLEEWIWFPKIMSAFGFEMDCDHSFDSHKSNCGLQLKKASNERERRKNDLYVLEHAERQIVGNHLFSQWRYYTHWNMAPVNKYDIDYLHRVIDILNAKL